MKGRFGTDFGSLLDQIAACSCYSRIWIRLGKQNMVQLVPGLAYLASSESLLDTIFDELMGCTQEDLVLIMDYSGEL